MSHLPDRPGLPVQVFAAQSQPARNHGIDATALPPSLGIADVSCLIALIVGIPTLDDDCCLIAGFRLPEPALPEIGEPAVSRIRPPEIFEGVSFPHQLSE